MKSHLGTLDGYLLDVQEQLDEHRRELNLPLPDRRPSELIIIELKDQIEEKDNTIEQLQGFTNAVLANNAVVRQNSKMFLNCYFFALAKFILCATLIIIRFS